MPGGVNVGDSGLCCCVPCLSSAVPFAESPKWGAADAEIKVPSGENTELKRSPCKAWSRSVYSYIYATLIARDFFLAYF